MSRCHPLRLFLLGLSTYYRQFLGRETSLAGNLKKLAIPPKLATHPCTWKPSDPVTQTFRASSFFKFQPDNSRSVKNVLEVEPADPLHCMNDLLNNFVAIKDLIHL